MTSPAPGPERRRLLRWTSFRAGLAVGLVAFLAGVWSLHLWLAPARSDGFNVDVTSRGSDVSAGGGASVVVRNKRGAVTQTCNGACDDLRYRAHDDENDYEVRVLDVRGACVACDQPRGVMGGYGAWSQRWLIAGQHPLKIIVNDRIGSLSWETAGEARSK